MPKPYLVIVPTQLLFIVHDQKKCVLDRKPQIICQNQNRHDSHQHTLMTLNFLLLIQTTYACAKKSCQTNQLFSKYGNITIKPVLAIFPNGYVFSQIF